MTIAVVVIAIVLLVLCFMCVMRFETISRHNDKIERLLILSEGDSNRIDRIENKIFKQDMDAITSKLIADAENLVKELKANCAKPLCPLCGKRLSPAGGAVATSKSGETIHGTTQWACHDCNDMILHGVKPSKTKRVK